MKKTVLLGMVIALLLLVGCEYEQSAEQKQEKATDDILTEINNEVGMPNLVNFQQKKLMKMIYELCDKENLICYAYIKSDYQGKLMFIGKCIGFGIPVSAQYTNPMKHIYGDVLLPQADPNGLYMPTSSLATWLMMIDPKTKEARPVYIEPEIVVSPFALHLIKSNEKNKEKEGE